MISDCENMSVKGGSEKPSRPGKILGNIGVIKSSRKVSFRYVNNKLYKQNCAPLKKTKKKKPQSIKQALSNNYGLRMTIKPEAVWGEASGHILSNARLCQGENVPKNRRWFDPVFWHLHWLTLQLKASLQETPTTQCWCDYVTELWPIFTMCITDSTAPTEGTRAIPTYEKYQKSKMTGSVLYPV